MAYQISYGPVKTKHPVARRAKTGRWLLLTLCAAALVVGLQVSEVGKTVWNWILPGDPQVTGAALDTMVEELKEGNSVGEAVTAFCREIIENAQLPE